MTTMQQSSFSLMATYNQWMNRQVYDAAAELRVDQLQEDRGAFFKSILGTLNHLLVGDTIWLQRFSKHPSAFASLQYVREIDPPTSLDAMPYSDFGGLQAARETMDRVIIEFANEVSETDLTSVLNYKNMAGEPSARNLAQLLLHFFNHQTHHRGQVSTLLNQLDRDIGVTDLLVLIPDQY
ncbi:MAG: DinB family protein [Granulosicoccus sp.]|nr:DinB family protein [Granulosicoccus sp.]